MSKILISIGFLIIICLDYGCKSDPQVESKALENQQMIDDALLKTNRFMVRRDQDHIANYVKRRAWDMEKTETGIWYMIIKKGSNERISEGEVVNYTFQLQLIDGTKIDSATSKDPHQWHSGKSNSESGLEEMMHILKKGTRAKIIIPPYLAYGNFGDAEKNIPPGAILVYDIEILNAQP